jgi:hypothetical protein
VYKSTSSSVLAELMYSVFIIGAAVSADENPVQKSNERLSQDSMSSISRQVYQTYREEALETAEATAREEKSMVGSGLCGCD